MLFFFQLIFACFSCASSHPTKLRSFIKLVIIKAHGWNFQSYSCGDNFFLDDNTSLNFRVDDSKDGCLKKKLLDYHKIFTNSYICYDVAMLPKQLTGFSFVLFSCFMWLYFFFSFSQMTQDRRNQEIVWSLNVLASDVHYQDKVLPILERTFCLRRRNLLSESIFWF